MQLITTDSCFSGSCATEPKIRQLSLILQAIDTLNKEFENGKIETVSFAGNSAKDFSEPIISYEITKQDKSHSSYVPIQANFYTSHYVGFYSTIINGQPVSITINPRFGETVRNHLFAHALGLYLPKGESGNESSTSKNMWLIALLWRANAEKALTKSQIPKVYKKITKNQSYFRGRLNITKQIKHNFVDESRFYCAYSKFSYENTINQAVRYCYRLLAKYGHRNILQGFAEHDEMLGDFGVSNSPVDACEIDKIVYTPMTKYYKPLMELSKSIINFKAYQNSSELSQKSGFSVFLDMAEVWENYLYNLLRKNLDDYEVENPNLTGDYPIFEDGSRKMRPDILIKKDGIVVMIIDAKYKYYTCIGKYANDNGAVSREDLYQMMSYLQRFGGGCDGACTGVFVSPFGAKEDPKKLKDSEHKIGVLGLEIDFKLEDNEKTIEQLKGNEEQFVETVREFFKL